MNTGKIFILYIKFGISEDLLCVALGRVNYSNIISKSIFLP